MRYVAIFEELTTNGHGRPNWNKNWRICDSADEVKDFLSFMYEVDCIRNVTLFQVNDEVNFNVNRNVEITLESNE